MICAWIRHQWKQMCRSEKIMTAISFICLVIVGFTLSSVIVISTARCDFCYAGPCHTSAVCGNTCSCLKTGSQFWGQCFNKE